MAEGAGDGDIAILGSGTRVQQCANLGLIDEYRLLVHPVISSAGKYLFKDVNKTNLKLLKHTNIEKWKGFSFCRIPP